MNWRFLALAGALLLASCSTSGVAIPLGTTTYAPTDPNSVVILASEPTRPHVDVALVDGTAATDDYFTQERTQAAAMKAMKEKAAELGAHAIVLTGKGSRPYGGKIFEKLQISGKAIRYTDAR